MEENISTFVSPTLTSIFGYCGDILLGSGVQGSVSLDKRDKLFFRRNLPTNQESTCPATSQGPV